MSVLLQPGQVRFVDVLKSLLAEPFKELKIAVAWAHENAVVKILPEMENFVVENGGHIEVVVGLNQRGTTVEALAALLRVADVYVFFKHPSQTFHPKLFLFENKQESRATVIVGSNNLTVGGIWSNFELALRLDLDLREEQQRRIHEDSCEVIKSLRESSNAVKITSSDLRSLFDAGLVPLEREVRRTAPKHPMRRSVPPTGVAAVLLGGMAPPEPMPVTARPPRIVGVPAFYVRTYTDTEIKKINKVMTGTLEYGIPLKVRDEAPQFWNWPVAYSSKKMKSGKVEEWYARALLFVDAKEIAAKVRIWDYARKHEFRISAGDLRPSNVTKEDIIVIERIDLSGYDFLIRHVPTTSPQYKEYSAYAIKRAAQHRYGYGPATSTLREL